MISHLLPAAGIAGLIKAALALHHRILPPTLHCDQPNPSLELASTPFYINTESRPWIHGGSEPRRAGVNAFGFGGINAHAVLEEYTAHGPSALLRSWDSEMCLVAGGSVGELVDAAERLGTWLNDNPDVALRDVAASLSRLGSPDSSRLALVATSTEDLRQKIEHAIRRLRADPTRRIKDRSGIFFTPDPLGESGRVAVMFPGEGSQYPNMLKDLCLHFPSARAPFDFLDRAFQGHARRPLPSHVIFPPPELDEDSSTARLWHMDHGAEAVFAGNQSLWNVLSELGFSPDGAMGHSTGEYSALLAAGALVLREEDLSRVILDLHEAFRRIASDGLVPEATLVAVGGVGRGVIDEVVAERADDVVVAMDNCPNQVVLCGTSLNVARVVAQLRARGAVCSPLPFGRAYHTPRFRPASIHLGAVFAAVPLVAPTIELYSCSTAERYPTDPATMRLVATNQWAETVRFSETIEAMYLDGYRVFVEAGAKGILTSFVHDVLRDRQHLAVSVGSAVQSGMRQLNETVAQLVANHVPLDLDALWARRDPQRIDFVTRPTAEQSTELQLSMGLQPLRLTSDRDPLRAMAPHLAPQLTAARPSPGAMVDSHPDRPPPTAGGIDALPSGASATSAMRAYFETMEHFLSVQSAVMAGHFEATAQGMSTAGLGDVAGVRGMSVEAETLDGSDVGSGAPNTPIAQVAQAGSEPARDEADHVEIASRPRSLGPIRPVAPNSPLPADLPFIVDVKSYVPGRQIVVRRRLDPSEDLFLLDHTLGGRISDFDSSLTALPIMPLTMTMEMLGEAASSLVPEAVVTRLENVRAHKWISFDRGPVLLELLAQSRDGSQAGSGSIAFDAQVRLPTDVGDPPNIVAEGTVVLGRAYPTPPRAEAVPTTAEQPWASSAELYGNGMFHGPAFQAVEALKHVGRDAIEATLLGLPADKTLFRSSQAEVRHRSSAPRRCWATYRLLGSEPAGVRFQHLPVSR